MAQISKDRLVKKSDMLSIQVMIEGLDKRLNDFDEHRKEEKRQTNLLFDKVFKKWEDLKNDMHNDRIETQKKHNEINLYMINKLNSIERNNIIEVWKNKLAFVLLSFAGGSGAFGVIEIIDKFLLK